MKVAELQEKLDAIRILTEEAGLEPIQMAVSMIGLALVGEFLIDIKRMADAVEERTRLAGSDPGRF